MPELPSYAIPEVRDILVLAPQDQPRTVRLGDVSVEATLLGPQSARVLSNSHDLADGRVLRFIFRRLRVSLLLTNRMSHILWLDNATVVVLEDAQGHLYPANLKSLWVGPSREARVEASFTLSEAQLRATRTLTLHIYDIVSRTNEAAVPRARENAQFSYSVRIRREEDSFERVKCATSGQEHLPASDVMAALARHRSFLAHCSRELTLRNWVGFSFYVGPRGKMSRPQVSDRSLVSPRCVEGLVSALGLKSRKEGWLAAVHCGFTRTLAGSDTIACDRSTPCPPGLWCDIDGAKGVCKAGEPRPPEARPAEAPAPVKTAPAPPAAPRKAVAPQVQDTE